MAKLLGIDVGTSATKAVLINEHGTVLRSASRDYPLATPHPGWAEQDPSDWVRAVHECLAEIGEKSPDAIGLTGQMHGMVPLDSEGMPVRPAILWCDQRTALECEEIDATLGPDQVRSTTCNPPMTGFQVPKVMWMRRNESEAFSRTRSILLPKDYLRYVLTGTKATDVTDASGTGVFDVAGRKWWSEGISGLGLDPDLFPDAHESNVVVAQTMRSEFLDQGVPVVAGAGDQAAGAVGIGATEPGVVSVSLGTSGVVFTSTDSPAFDSSGSINSFCHANGSWHAMGVMLSCGGAIKWARDAFFSDISFSEFDHLAASAPSGCEGLTFLPHLSGERCPFNDPAAKGALAGLSSMHSRGHVARAVLEGVTFGLRGCYEKLGTQATEVRVTGGGSKSSFWMQLLADALQVHCVRMAADEGPALGAAILAGVGVGIWTDVESATRSVVAFGDRFSPGLSSYEMPFLRFNDLYPTLKDWNSRSIALQ